MKSSKTVVGHPCSTMLCVVVAILVVSIAGSSFASVLSEDNLVVTSDTGGSHETQIAIYGDTVAVTGRGASALLGVELFDLSDASPLEPEFVSVPARNGLGAVAISASRLAIGSPFPTSSRRVGSVFLIDRGNQEIVRELQGSLLFGFSTSLSDTYVAVGDPAGMFNGTQSGAAHLYSSLDGDFMRTVGPTDSDSFSLFGAAVDLSDDHLLVGASQADDSTGKAYLFDVDTGRQLFELEASDRLGGDRFGDAVALDDHWAIVGATGLEPSGNEGAAYVFDVTTGEEIWKLTPDDNSRKFGVSVDIQNDLAIVGASFDDEFGELAGAAYVFDLNSGTQIAKITQGRPSARDEFGNSVAIGNRFAVATTYSGEAVQIAAIPEPTGALSVIVMYFAGFSAARVSRRR